MITPVLLCGGSGTRLWPLSRTSFPKQFAQITGEESLFQASARRLSGPGFAAPIIVTGHDFRFIVREQLAAIGITPARILIEPEGRNTAPAAIAAALVVAQDDPEALVLLAPSDHAIPDEGAFCSALEQARAPAVDGQIVSFGITPTRPETGYGWIETGDETHPGVHDLTRFVEKPDADRAQMLFDAPGMLWNAGIFLATARCWRQAFSAHAPQILDTVNAALERRVCDLGFSRIDPDLWADVPEESIDYAIMEKASNVSVVRLNTVWSDLGSWEAVWQESQRDNDGNALCGNSLSMACENTLLRSENEQVELVGIGLKNIVAIAMPDAVMVADMSQSQNVKSAVSVLRDRGARQAEQFPIDHRPWGWFETLVLGDRFQVKRIHVKPGASLSLQSHVHRSEHWIVVQGTASVTIGNDTQLVSENQSIYVPLGAVHRMSNPGKVPMVLIEVQTGAYLGEDDITRYEDQYARG